MDEDTFTLLAQRVEASVRARGVAEIASHDVGLAARVRCASSMRSRMLRFASVHKSFDSLEEFEREIAVQREAVAAWKAAQQQSGARRAPAGGRTP